MRLNQYIARATGVSRRSADRLITAGDILVNNKLPLLGQTVQSSDNVSQNGRVLSLPDRQMVIAIHKPTGYICSRNGQGSATIYQLLPKKYHHLKSVGRLDKDSSGLLILTSDGQLSHQLTHPSFKKTKTYLVRLAKPLSQADLKKLSLGVNLEDGQSVLHVSVYDVKNNCYEVRMNEGRNRQIRRTFLAINNQVIELRRTGFGPYDLGNLAIGQYQELETISKA
jgi:23S rRNA pseudouridine2605 synthase